MPKNSSTAGVISATSIIPPSEAVVSTKAVRAPIFTGTVVLEQLAAIGRVEEFFDAIDCDDTERAVSLMKKAKIDAPTIAIVVRKMNESEGEH